MPKSNQNIGLYYHLHKGDLWGIMKIGYCKRTIIQNRSHFCTAWKQENDVDVRLAIAVARCKFHKKYLSIYEVQAEGRRFGSSSSYFNIWLIWRFWSQDYAIFFWNRMKPKLEMFILPWCVVKMRANDDWFHTRESVEK